jgi:hypothetical protein
MNRLAWPLLMLATAAWGGEYERRVDEVRKTRGFVALWDFVKRDGGRFAAHQGKAEGADLRLDVVNYVRDYWNVGRAARPEDVPFLSRGPFGAAVQFKEEPDLDLRPLLLVPRERLHGSGLDVKGPGRSVSMVAWVVRTGGNHAVAGIWHEGTDLHTASGLAARVEPGKRQYAIFAGLAGNNGASAVHLSENGGKSFGDKYARNLAVTPEVIPQVPATASGPELDAAWSVVGFAFDNRRNVATAYLNGKASEYWIDEPQKHPFYQWPARGWQQAQLSRIPGVQTGEDPGFPRDQFYEPPEKKVLSRRLISEQPNQRVELLEYAFTKVRVTLGKDESGRFRVLRSRELASLKANPFWFGHDLYAPRSLADGGPFTIGRVIHSGRSVGFTGWIGGVAVFGRGLSPAEMQRLARVAEAGVLPGK